MYYIASSHQIETPSPNEVRYNFELHNVAMLHTVTMRYIFELHNFELEGHLHLADSRSSLGLSPREKDVV